MKEGLPIPAAEEKETAVQRMFSSAARRYDLNNTLLSFGLHHYWKRAAVAAVGPLEPEDRVLDLCAGTADLAILLARRAPGGIVAVDLNEEMLAYGKQKIDRAGLSGRITCRQGNAEALEFPDGTFHAVMAAFGIRNVARRDRAFAEIFRVLAPGGRFLCLEFSRPTTSLLRVLYDFYSFTLLPKVGSWVSRDRTGIYRYLPASIRAFPDQERLKRELEEAGFREVTYRNLSGGIVALHIGVK
jgi:demethylmenaquinone methyltransferase/2-methoxy-6-polyprenyl-1,4-benzoquinol methylase